MSARLFLCLVLAAWTAGLGGCEEKGTGATKKGTAATDPAGGPDAPATKGPQVVIKTTLGEIRLVLFADKSPVTVKNFLRYVDDRFYEGTIFHRVKSDFMIQGGGFTTDLQPKPTRAPIKNEADNGLSNRRGTVAMARTPAVHSARSQFFINVVDNTRLDHQGPGPGFGYAVFGRVVKGMEVVDRIRNTPVAAKSQMFTHLPETPVVIQTIRRVK